MLSTRSVTTARRRAPRAKSTAPADPKAATRTTPKLGPRPATATSAQVNAPTGARAATARTGETCAGHRGEARFPVGASAKGLPQTTGRA